MEHDSTGAQVAHNFAQWVKTPLSACTPISAEVYRHSEVFSRN
jgi:hypothetical protein